MGISTAVDPSAVARVVGIETRFRDLRGGNVLYLPQRVAVIGQGSTAATFSTDKVQVTSAQQAGELFGFGSPIHLAVRQLLPVNGDGVGSIPVTVYPLDDAGGSAAAVGSIAPTGSQTAASTIVVRVNNIDSQPVTIAAGTSVASVCTALTAAINAVLEMPVVAVDGTTDVDLTSKWQGASANDLVVEVIETGTGGLGYTITQPAGGAGNPDVDPALAQFGNVWETMVLNCLDIADTTTLGKINTAGEGRWGALVRKPFVAFTGNVAASVANATAVSDARKTDRINAQLVSPGSNDLPFVVAARQLARIVRMANNNPAHDYGSQQATGLVPGADADQWDYNERDQAVKAGSSTIEVKDGVVNLSDVVTFYHPSGDPLPAYRYVVDIVKLQNILFNLDLLFTNAEWDGAPLIPDDQPTTNRSAKKPKMAVAAVCAMLDQLGLEAIISDPDTAKANTFAEIDSGNPKRLNLTTTVQLSGNTNIVSATLNWGFYFGTAAVVA